MAKKEKLLICIEAEVDSETPVTKRILSSLKATLKAPEDGFFDWDFADNSDTFGQSFRLIPRKVSIEQM